MMHRLTHNQKEIEQIESVSKIILGEMDKLIETFSTRILYEICMDEAIMKRITVNPYSIMLFLRIRSSQHMMFDYLFTKRLNWKEMRTEGDDDTIDLVYTESISKLLKDTLNVTSPKN